MATVAGQTGAHRARRDSFFFYGALAQAAVLASGFVFHLAMGRSSFGAPLYVHVHALTYFGWVTLYVAQVTLAARGSIALHRRLGWVAPLWIALMVVAGTVVAVEATRLARSAPMFTPGYFLIMAPAEVYAFAGLATAAIILRREPDWHKRLHFCAMSALMGPGFGRLLPMPLFIPYTPWVEGATALIFPLIGIALEARRGHVHRAWWWGLGTLLAVQVLIHALAASPFASLLYAAVTAGSPGAALDPFAYRPLPGS